MKIGAKLYVGFITVVVIFSIVAVYMIIGLQTLHHEEEEMGRRALEAIEMHDIEADVISMYAVIADGIINRDVEEFKADFEEAKATAAADVKHVHEMVDHEDEREWATQYEAGLNSYLGLVDERLTPILEKEESVQKRAEDSLAIMDMEIHVGHIYAVMADGIINQDIVETTADFTAIKEESFADMARLDGLVDTEEERRDAEALKEVYTEYLTTFEAMVLPELQSDSPRMSYLREADEILDGLREETVAGLQAISASLAEETAEVLADEAAIRALDEDIDTARDATLIPLEKLVESLLGEHDEAAQSFDATLARIDTVTIILSIAGIVMALALAFIITRGITRPLTKVTEVSSQVAKGDFAVEDLDIRSKDEVGIMAKSFSQMLDVLKYKASIIEQIAEGNLTTDIEMASNVDGLGKSLVEMSDSLNELLSQVSIAVQQVTSGSTQVSQAGQALSQGAAEQASSLEEITSSLTEVNGQSRQNAENATEANALARKAVEDAEGGNAKMKDLLSAMERINASSDEISKIVKVIDDIAFQINLLALNANVEAARAGKYGKGFAVVAEEVRNLAVRSAEAVKETTSMVEETTSAITDGTAAAETTAQQLEDIVQGSTKVAEYLGDIALASKEQAQGIEQTNSGLEQIDQVTQGNTASAEESASAAEELAAQAQQLAGMISRFKLKNNVSFIGEKQESMALPQAAPAGNGNGNGADGSNGHETTEPVAAEIVDPKQVIQLDDEDFSGF